MSGRRPGGRAVALCRLRALPALPRRLGDPLREPEEHRLFRERRFAEYVVADPNYIGHLPPNLDFVEIAPVLCAGVTVYKGLKVTDTKPGDWVVISGIGGLGHMAVQYARAMGLNVARSISTIPSSTSRAGSARPSRSTRCTTTRPR